ncbi:MULTISPECIES: nitronate monooxygenase [Pandoraea]|uniref:NAD(P)H-dependent flavin oxidoreductase n=1 Tax=Pandoraea TaxID=93217 RepID=UPI001F5C4732|nr:MULTISPECIES: nitronate monooxygenase [Pandoraea]MCI3208169.1 nitronate monooxygenase [Pandoraea sp. LA3]MDN4586198.1 nitronate monooxygenase [Pandoraea capi]
MPSSNASQSRNRALIERLGLLTPIIQAPMAGTSTPALAAAVSNAGGLGSVGVAAVSADAARKVIHETRALTRKPFNVNVFCHAPAKLDTARDAAWLAYLAPEFARFEATPPATLSEIYKSFVADDAMYTMLLEERPDVVSFHFGLPSQDKIDALHAAGITLFATATNLAEAKAIEAAGIDAIVAQGYEAGGHRGCFEDLGDRVPTDDEQLGTLALVRLIVTHTSVPVIAAGGIMDGAGIAAVLALGAQAAQLGTAFVACPESSADAAYRERLAGPNPPRTALIRAISGRPARGFVNRLYAIEQTAERPDLPAYPVTYDAGKALNAAAKAKGNSDYAAQWAGQAAPLARALPAAELVGVLRTELHETFDTLRELATTF